MKHRRYTSGKDRFEILKRQGGFCAYPNCCTDLFRGSYQIDHVTPLALGGKDTLANKQALCPKHHHLKTSGKRHDVTNGDVHKIAKTKRLAKGGRKRKGRKMQSKPFRKYKPGDCGRRWKRSALI